MVKTNFKEVFDNYRKSQFAKDGAFDFEWFLTKLTPSNQLEKVLDRIQKVFYN